MNMIRIYRLFAVVLLVIMSGCQRSATNSAVVPVDRKPASLVITADISALMASVDTRASVAEEKTIDHVSLFLIDSLDNRLVAYRNIYGRKYPLYPSEYNDMDADNGFVNSAGDIDTSLESGKAVRVTFDYENPKHGPVEKLSRGTYVMLAVANYADSDTFGNSGIAKQVQALIDSFDRNEGIADFRQTCTDFYNLMLRIPDKTDPDGKTYAPYLRPGNVYIPLTCTHMLHLISGTNTEAIGLEHTCARLQIDVRNYSEMDLTVNDLALSDNFTQSACYLFSRADTDLNYAVEYEHRGKGAPIITDDNALVKFEPNRIVSNADGVTTIFDGLIYESRDEADNYRYTIDVGYDGAGINMYALKNNDEPITTVGDIASQGPYFLIGRRGDTWGDVYSFLYVENDKIYATPSDERYTPQQILDKCADNNYLYNYVWKLEWASGTSRYYMRNVQTEDYVGKLTSNNIETENGRLVMVGAESMYSSADTFTVSSTNGYFLFKSDNYTWGDAYINTRGDRNTLVTGWYGDGEWSQFVLYPLRQTTGLNARHEVVLRTIDGESSVVSDVHEIRRNDHIHVLVEVSYNPDKGDFEFYVRDWNSVNGDITFN